MSDILGEGYGSSHSWKIDITDKFMYRKVSVTATRYRCRACSEVFVHPHELPGIFEAMEIRGVTDQCPGTIQVNADPHNTSKQTPSDSE